jgi:hypothetical protein
MIVEMKKNDFRFVEENGRIFALEIFGLVLFPNITGIISLQVSINSIMAILVEAILTLNYCRRASKGSMRCYEQLCCTSG